MKIKIMSDSTCDLSKELQEKYNITLVPLTVIKNDYGLLSSCDEDVSLIVHISNVTRSKPTVLGEYLCGSLGVLVIAEHYVVALNENFTRFLALGAVYLDGTALNGSTNRVELYLSG